jgi:hypothetical protein
VHETITNKSNKMHLQPLTGSNCILLDSLIIVWFTENMENVIKTINAQQARTTHNYVNTKEILLKKKYSHIYIYIWSTAQRGWITLKLSYPYLTESNTLDTEVACFLVTEWALKKTVTEKLRPNYKDLGRAMAQAVSRRPPTAEDRVWSRVVPCGICGGKKWHWDRFFSEYLGFLPVLH